MTVRAGSAKENGRDGLTAILLRNRRSSYKQPAPNGLYGSKCLQGVSHHPFSDLPQGRNSINNLQANHGCVAQLVEHSAFNRIVRGSSPRAPIELFQHPRSRGQLPDTLLGWVVENSSIRLAKDCWSNSVLERWCMSWNPETAYLADDGLYYPRDENGNAILPGDYSVPIKKASNIKPPCTDGLGGTCALPGECKEPVECPYASK